MFLTTTPTLSQSGSVPTIISAPFSLAIDIAISNTAFSSGFGYSTVENFESGISCSLTTSTFLNPTSSKAFLIGKLPVPCIGVNIIFISLPTLSIMSCLITCSFTASINALSTVSSNKVINSFSSLVVGIVL